MTENDDKQIILVVDDIPQNIDVLANILKADYLIKVAIKGEIAIEIAQEDPQPDLILLDIMMPGMDGYEVCRKLKNDQNTKNIPIIFVTALNEMEDEQKGLEAGAIDYITKPISPAIVKARVKNHLLLRHYQANLEDLVKKRTMQLAETCADLKKEMEERAKLEAVQQEIQKKVMVHDKLATIGQVATGVAHELNQPLTYITTIIQTTIEKLQNNKIDPEKLIVKFKKAAHQAARILDITTHLRTVGRSDDAKREAVSLADILEDSLVLVNERMKLRNIVMHKSIPDNLPSIMGIHNKLEQVFINLTTNAIDALEEKGGGDIEVEMLQKDDNVVISFADNAGGMPPEIKDKIFEPFFTTKERGKGTGLGMAIINDIIVDHNGEITCRSELGKGTVFTITLPI